MDLASGVPTLRDRDWSFAGSAPVTAPSHGHIPQVSSWHLPGWGQQRLVQVAEVVDCGTAMGPVSRSAFVTQLLTASAKPLPSHQMRQDRVGEGLSTALSSQQHIQQEQEEHEISLLSMSRAAGRACGGNSEGCEWEKSRASGRGTQPGRS